MRQKNGITLLLLATIVCSCQEEDYGFTSKEIHQAATERNYQKEFHKVFPDIDSDHTWMCTPDTIYGYSRQAQTRAAVVPSIVRNTSKSLTLAADAVSSALNYMKEGDDNRGKCAQNFEFLAVEETTYDIYPTFWGRKFSDTNYVGIYYINDNGKMVELESFWNDTDETIVARFSGGNQETVQKTADPITDVKERNYRYSSHPVESFILPAFSLTVPAGVKWGIYLKTRKQQNSNDPITWYSNASFNDDGVVAAATFTYDGITYCSFEDAPHNIHNGRATGNCQCGYGHYDQDFNDIVLTITPRPIESTYRAIKYRVMCEDLGGTFDWDFNDVVYDIVYEDGKGKGTPASISVILQAVGGTLPVYMDCQQACSMSDTKELHQLMGQQPAEDGELYEPINVNATARSIVLPSRVVFTYELDFDHSDSYDIRSFVRSITIRVGADESTTTEITFPDEHGDKAPQCFMTSVGTEWTDELQNITTKYPEFTKWVKNQQSSEHWWTPSF